MRVPGSCGPAKGAKQLATNSCGSRLEHWLCQWTKTNSPPVTESGAAFFLASGLSFGLSATDWDKSQVRWAVAFVVVSLWAFLFLQTRLLLLQRIAYLQTCGFTMCLYLRGHNFPQEPGLAKAPCFRQSPHALVQLLPPSPLRPPQALRIQPGQRWNCRTKHKITPAETPNS